MRADNATWEKFNNTSARICGVDVRLAPPRYKDYIRQIHGEREWTNLETRCGRRANAEIREIASLAKPTPSQSSWFKQRCDSGEKSGEELNGPLGDQNWLRRLIIGEQHYLWQFPWNKKENQD